MAALRRRAWVTGGLVVALAAGGLTATQAQADSTAGERPASTHHLALGSAGTVPERSTDRFSAVTLTWTDAGAALPGTAQVRTRDAKTGHWSGWRALGADEAKADGREGAEKHLRGGTAMLWTGAADGVQARVVHRAGSALPTGLTLDLIDPGTTAAVTPLSATSCNPPSSPLDPAPTSPVARPPIIPRSAWGASENLECDPSYGTEVHAVVVHHTATTNNYSCDSTPAQLRSIQQSHFARGFNDIGYNFLVDKCGRIFEGRGGGVDQPVVGAHDVGFNTDLTGIAYLGNTDTARPTRAAYDAIARLAAWKLRQFGYDPGSSVKLVSGADDPGSKYQKGESVTLPRVFGHRDTFRTECPGDILYGRLGLLRTLARAPGVSHALPTSDYNRDGRGDMVAGVPRAASGAGEVAVVPGGSTGPVVSSKRLLTQNSSGVPGVSEAGDAWGTSAVWGDLNGDGYADLVVGAPGEDGSTAADTGAVTVLYGPGLTSGGGYGAVPAGSKIGGAVTVGDFDADGKADAFAAGTGNLWWTRMSGSGALKTGKVTAAPGAIGYVSATSGDFDRDGYADVALGYRDQGGTGRVQVFRGGASGLSAGTVLATRGGRSLASGDFDRDGYADLVIGQPVAAESGSSAAGGAVTAVYGSSSGLSTAKVLSQSTASVPGADEPGDALGTSVAAGDVNLDGYADVLAGGPGEDITRSGVNEKDAGTSILFRGSSSGLTGSGSAAYHQDTSGIGGVTEPSDRLGTAVTLTDLTGWARTDLAIGVAGENASDGTILQLDSGSAGIFTSGGVYYDRTELGTPAGGRLGGVLAP